MNDERAERRAAILVTEIGDDEQRLVAADALGADPLAEALESGAALRQERHVRSTPAASYFLTVQVPPVRLVMIGAVHISQALAPIARIAGLDPSIIDPRTAFATPERFPDAPVVAQWPDEALDAAPLDRYTAICLLTHDPKIDDRALVRALERRLFLHRRARLAQNPRQAARADARAKGLARRRWRAFTRRSASTSAR